MDRSKSKSVQAHLLAPSRDAVRALRAPPPPHANASPRPTYTQLAPDGRVAARRGVEDAAGALKCARKLCLGVLA